LIEYIKKIFKKSLTQKYEDIFWGFFYYDRLGKRINCVIMEDMLREEKYLVYTQHKTKDVIKYKDLNNINDLGVNKVI
jgi:hypothetical protein